jgi:hypothetical protein
MTNTAEFQDEYMHAGRLETRPFGLMKVRELARPAVLTRAIRLGKALKELEAVRQSDEVGRKRILSQTETIKGTFFLSPSGTEVYGLKPTTRTIDGRKIKMLSIKSVTPVGEVLSFTEAR